MEWKYRKDFQVMPGISITYGNNGIQTQVHSLDGPSDLDTDFETSKLKHQLFKPYEVQHEIKSAFIDSLTSPDLKEFKSVLSTSYKVYNETKSLLEVKSSDQANRLRKLERLKNSLFKFLFKKKIRRLSEELTLLTAEVQ